jgi:hypothetical protein
MQVIVDTVKTNTIMSTNTIYAGMWQQDEQQPLCTLRAVGPTTGSAGWRRLYFANDAHEHSNQLDLPLSKMERTTPVDEFPFGAMITTGQTELIQ